MAIFRALLLLGLATMAQAMTDEVECVERVQCENLPRPDATTTDVGGRKLQTVTGATARELVDTLIDQNLITVTNPVLTCADRASGIVTFSGGVHAFEDEGFEDATAIVLSSGDAAVVEGVTNNLFGTTNINDTPGDPDADALAGATTNDACVLEFDFEVTPGFFTAQLTFEYIFASEEYNDFILAFNDPFGLFVDGENIGVVTGTDDPVTVSTVNAEINSEFFMNNEIFPSPFNTEYDGFTTVLASNTIFAIFGTTYSAKLVIADAVDSAFDSSVVLRSAIIVAGGE